jgi:hypothetical protein
MRFHKTNNISQNFSCVSIVFHEVSKSFVGFQFCFWYFRKMTAKFRFLLNRFEITKFRTFRWQKLNKSISQLPNVDISSVWSAGGSTVEKHSTTDNNV